MKEIAILRFYKMDISEHYSFANSIISLLNDEIITKYELENCLVIMENSFEKVYEIFNTDRKSEKTVVLRTKDRLRIYTFVTFRKKVELTHRMGTPAE